MFLLRLQTLLSFARSSSRRQLGDDHAADEVRGRSPKERSQGKVCQQLCFSVKGQKSLVTHTSSSGLMRRRDTGCSERQTRDDRVPCASCHGTPPLSSTIGDAPWKSDEKWTSGPSLFADGSTFHSTIVENVTVIFQENCGSQTYF